MEHPGVARHRSWRRLPWPPLLAALSIAQFGAASAQSGDVSSRPAPGVPSSASPLDLLLPETIRAGYLTRAWVRDSLPPAGDSLDDLSRLDMLYLHALGEAGGDPETALFASLIASFEHHTIPFSIGVDLPLTLEPHDLFERRVALLPQRLFLDSPAGDDRDKLQHFFASAWLAATLDNGPAADLIGLGVETGEELFIRGGADDRRDVRANRLGHLFAQLLRQHPRALPSVMFRAWNREYLRRVNEERNGKDAFAPAGQ